MFFLFGNVDIVFLDMEVFLKYTVLPVSLSADGLYLYWKYNLYSSEILAGFVKLAVSFGSFL